MQIFIDDSGSFEWAAPGLSLFCGVTLPDRERDALFDRFTKWRRSIIGLSNRELKGSELTDRQLHSFTTKVLPNHSRGLWLTVVGIDTRQTRKDHVEQVRDQSAVKYKRASEIMAEYGNLKMEGRYREMAGWMRSRSPQNLLWMIGVEQAISDSLQHSIVRLDQPEDDAEFEDVRILIDESFIRREDHVRFWKEWLRNQLEKKTKTEPKIIPDAWRQRDQPFIRAFSVYPGLLNLNRLYWRQMGFFRSCKFPGIQIADICAHAIRRYHRNDGGGEAYGQLRRRIVGRRGTEIHLIGVNQQSIDSDPMKSVGVFNAELRRRVRELQSP